MSPEEFEAVTRQALAGLPAWVHEALDNIELLVVDEAGEELGEEARELLGLYVGVPLTERSSDYAWELPDLIYIFRRPHLELDLPESQLREEIARTLLHEIAHYFGIDDEHLDEMGWA